MQQMNSKDSEAMDACGWDDVFWEEIGLGDLVEGHYTKIGILPYIISIFESGHKAYLSLFLHFVYLAHLLNFPIYL